MPHPSAPPSLAALRTIRILDGLDDAALLQLRPRLAACSFAPGDLILSPAVPPEYLYFVLNGRVRVELAGLNGEIFNLAELEAGAIFGERAILTGEPRTADVRALTAVTAARLARSDFETLLRDAAPVAANLCRHLAGQLGTWADRHRQEEREQRAVIANVIGWQLLPEFGAFPGASPSVRALNQRLEELGQSEKHVAILGEAGTWKDLAARLIHFHGDGARPVLFLDCAAPPPVPGQGNGNRSATQDVLLAAIAQESALFGYLPDSALYAQRVRRGLLELADGGDLILRNIDALVPAVQAQLAAFLETGAFRRRGERETRTVRTRVIATSTEPLDRLAEAGNFHRPLWRHLAGETVVMTPLRERKQDIPTIARALLPNLNARHHKAVRRISQDALNRLVDHDWPLNGSELYQVVSRAVLVCSGEEIQTEQIFLQGQLFEGGRFNLLTLPLVERLARRPDFPRLLRWATVPLFILILFATLGGPDRANAANLAVWTLWWPALLATALVVARGWCSYCPLEALGEFVGAKNRVVSTPPRWLHRWGPGLSLSGLAAIILVEQASGMFAWSRATGFLLMALLLATALADLVLGQRGWCKYLCPLGRIVSLISRIALLEMHSNRNVCVSRCRVDDCVRERGCPMGLHPTGIGNADHCILCLNCVRSCPHHAMQLDLRNPALGLSARGGSTLHEALFSLTLAGVIIAAKGTPYLFGRSAEVFPARGWGILEFAVGIVVTLTIPLLAWLLSLSVPGRPGRSVFTTCGPAYLPLAVSGLFLLYFRAFIEGGAQVIPWLLASLGLATWFDPTLVTPDLGTLRLTIYPLILAGFAFSWQAIGRRQREDLPVRHGLLGHRLLMATIAGLFVVLL